ERVGKSVVAVVVTKDADPVRRLTEVARSVLDVASVDVTPYASAAAAGASPNDGLRAREHTSARPDAPTADRRVVDLGPEARGSADDDKLKLAGAKIAKMSKTIRFDVEKLDELMNLVGEMVIERTRLIQIASSIEDQFGESALVTDLREASVRIGRITEELQQKTMSARMLPIENVFSRFPRMVRDLAVKNNKAVDFIIQGQETELDRSVIEQIGDPLIHLLRNAVDHGLETPDQREAAGKPRTGTIRLAAYLSESENMIVLEVEDDGRGIDAQKLRAKAVERGLLTREQADRLSDREAVELIFAAGLSTAEKVTDISGRGVGMDIVRANIEKLNGSIVIDTALGRGTKFTVRVPLTLAIIPVLLVLVGDIVVATPLVSVMETLRIRHDEIKTVRGQETVQLRNTVLPLVRLRHVFGMPPAEQSDRAFVVAVKWGERMVGLVVDNLVGNQEIVIKPLGRLFSGVDCLSGAMILGDGRVGLILDVPGLVKRAIRQHAAGRAA
ncbi:MAG: chemotaxis protein CheA, partial [Dehalococcoidia bacterium]|nr:chemotaxis protein CheA [Dehalococcoidia bacterium]